MNTFDHDAKDSRRRTRPTDVRMTIRMPAHTRDLIDAAAASLGKSRSEFVLDCARQYAVDALLDRRVFSLDADASEAFAEALSAPIVPNPSLKSLLATKSPWE